MFGAQCTCIKRIFVRFVYNILYLSDCSSVGFTKSAGTNEEQLHGCGDLGQENKCREWQGSVQSILKDMVNILMIL